MKLDGVNSDKGDFVVLQLALYKRPHDAKLVKHSRSSPDWMRDFKTIQEHAVALVTIQYVPELIKLALIVMAFLTNKCSLRRKQNNTKNRERVRADSHALAFCRSISQVRIANTALMFHFIHR